MVNQRFRAIYLAALIVFCVGLLGVATAPKAKADIFGRSASKSLLLPVKQRIAESSKPLASFAALGMLSSFSLALLYSKTKL